MTRKLHVVLVLAGLLLCARASFGAIAYDNASTAASAGGASGLTFSHTVNGNTEGVLYVGCSWFGAASMTSVTYAGSAMTRVANKQGSGNNAFTEVYRLKAPATGANNVVATLSGALPASSNIGCGALSLTGVDQTTPEDNTAACNTGGANANVTCSLTVNTTNSWLLDAFSSGGTGGLPTPNGAQTLIGSGNAVIPDPSWGVSYKGPMATGSQSMSWTLSTARKWAQVVVSVKPAAIARNRRRAQVY